MSFLIPLKKFPNDEGIDKSKNASI